MYDVYDVLAQFSIYRHESSLLVKSMEQVIRVYDCDLGFILKNY